MTVITGQQIPIARMMALRSMLKLEIRGLSRKGRSAYAIIKDEFGLRGSKQKVYDQFDVMIKDAVAKEAETIIK